MLGEENIDVYIDLIRKRLVETTMECVKQKKKL